MCSIVKYLYRSIIYSILFLQHLILNGDDVMFKQMCKIDDTAIKIDQVKTLMGMLIEYRDTMPQKYQDNIVHVAFDILSCSEETLLEVSTELSGRKIAGEHGEHGEQKGNKRLQTS
jgi:hypothetical protein